MGAMGKVDANKALFALFETEGEANIRIKLALGQYPSAQAAKVIEWIRQKDEGRLEARSAETMRISRQAVRAAAAAAIAAAAAAVAAIYTAIWK